MKIAEIFGVSDFRGKRGSSLSLLGMKKKSDLTSAVEERTGDMEKFWAAKCIQQGVCKNVDNMASVCSLSTSVEVKEGMLTSCFQLSLRISQLCRFQKKNTKTKTKTGKILHCSGGETFALDLERCCFWAVFPAYA